MTVRAVSLVSCLSPDALGHSSIQPVLGTVLRLATTLGTSPKLAPSSGAGTSPTLNATASSQICTVCL
jgi:hypothetical protein